MSNDNDQLATIDAETLDDVTGGAASTDTQLTAAIQGIQSSLKSIGSNSSSGNALTQILPFLLFARGGASGGIGGGCPCGCGMANCRR